MLLHCSALLVPSDIPRIKKNLKKWNLKDHLHCQTNTVTLSNFLFDDCVCSVYIPFRYIISCSTDLTLLLLCTKCCSTKSLYRRNDSNIFRAFTLKQHNVTFLHFCHICTILTAKHVNTECLSALNEICLF